MVVNITKGQIWSGMHYIKSKNGVTRSTNCVENFILVSQTAQGWYTMLLY